MDVAFLAKKSPWLSENFNLKDLAVYNYKKRFIFDDLKGVLEQTNLMLQISGLRRLGKTTLMLQLIIDLIQNKQVDPKKIIFVEFTPLDNDLEYVLKNAPQNGYVFLDEIQYCQNWRDILKYYYDSALKTNSRIIFSGSATIAYTKGKESLLGRFMPVNITPLRFNEYIYLKYGSENTLHYNRDELYEYISYGEFPDLIFINSREYKEKYIRESILNPLFTSDLDLYSIEKKAEFALIFKLLSANIGQVINKQNIASEAGISRALVDKYIAIMEDMNLIKLVPNYYKSAREVANSAKKVYAVSINLALNHLGLLDIDRIPLESFKGSIFENFVFNELNKTHNTLYYWRRRDKELDFVIEKNGEFFTYEVKTKKEMGKREAEMYKRYANEISKGANFASILLNFDKDQSGLVGIFLC